MHDKLIEGLRYDAGDYRRDSDGVLRVFDQQNVRAWDAAQLLSRLNPGDVRDWAAERFSSDTLLDQDRRMVAAETEAFISGRSGRESSTLSEEARNAGPVTSPEVWRDRKISAMMTALADLGLAPVWWGGTQFREVAEALLESQEDI